MNEWISIIAVLISPLIAVCVTMWLEKRRQKRRDKMDLFEQSMRMINELNQELSQSEFVDGGLRLDLVYQCCDISIEHGLAVKTLLEAELFTSALAVFRTQFESLVRAYR